MEPTPVVVALEPKRAVALDPSTVAAPAQAPDLDPVLVAEVRAAAQPAMAAVAAWAVTARP